MKTDDLSESKELAAELGVHEDTIYRAHMKKLDSGQKSLQGLAIRSRKSPQGLRRPCVRETTQAENDANGGDSSRRRTAKKSP